MNHAFLLNLHKDCAQGLKLVKFLHQHKASYRGWPRIYLSYDGPHEWPSEWDTLKPYADYATTAPYAPDKATGICSSLNRLALRAMHDGVGVATLLHSDIIPWHAAHFMGFLADFVESGKAMTYCPMWPKHKYASFIGPTFNLKKCYEQKILPIRLDVMKKDDTGYCNEGLFSNHLKLIPGWREDIYPVWQMTFPYTGQVEDPYALKLGHSVDEQFFVVNDLVPESSIMHCNDERFWSNLQHFCKW